MRVHLWYRMALVLALAAAVLAAAHPASAQGPGIPTLLTMPPIGPVRTDEDFTVTVRLTTQPGTGIPGMAVQLFLDGANPRQAQTDATGSVTYLFRSLPVGAHRLIAVFNGAQGYQAASVSMDLLVTGASRTSLTLQPLGVVPMGRDVRITAYLANAVGSPVSGVGLELSVNGESMGSSLTDERGIASLHINRVLAVGTYDILVTFRGSRSDSPASATMKLQIRNPEIELRTVPVLEGVRFSVNGRVFASDKNGVARLPVDEPGVYHVQVLPYESAGSDARIEFGRWEDDVFSTYHDVTVPSDSGPLQVGYDVSYKVRWTFVDLESHRVDPKRVTSITLKGSDGAVYTFPSDQTQWLPALHVIKRLTGLEESALQYSVMDVQLNGTNVVSAMQQRFYVQPNDTWQIQLLLFTAHFSSRDTVFGFPLGQSLRLEYPDRSVENVPLDSKGEATVVSLPRGLYKVNVQQVPGISPQAPLAMSRDQEVVLQVISYLDIAAGVLVMLLFGPGLLLIGRPALRTAIWNLRPIGRSRRRAELAMATVDESELEEGDRVWRRKVTSERG